MSVIKAYSSNSAKVGIDGVPLAGVELAEEYERHSEYPVHRASENKKARRLGGAANKDRRALLRGGVGR